MLPHRSVKPPSIDDEAHTARARGRRRLLVVAGLFFVPFIAAMLLHFSGWRPTGQVNRGALVSPPTLLPPLQATELGTRAQPAGSNTWTVLIVSHDGCSDACRRALDDTRRVIDLLGRDRDRVRRVLLATERLDASPLAEHSDLVAVDASAPENSAIRDALAQAADGAVYVADPRHYLMLRYDPGQNAKDLLDDLQRLLKYSG
jgi:hypothetical protein